jgi:hypothetical protein
MKQFKSAKLTDADEAAFNFALHMSPVTGEPLIPIVELSNCFGLAGSFSDMIRIMRSNYGGRGTAMETIVCAMTTLSDDVITFILVFGLPPVTDVQITNLRLAGVSFAEWLLRLKELLHKEGDADSLYDDLIVASQLIEAEVNVDSFKEQLEKNRRNFIASFNKRGVPKGWDTTNIEINKPDCPGNPEDHDDGPIITLKNHSSVAKVVVPEILTNKLANFTMLNCLLIRYVDNPTADRDTVRTYDADLGRFVTDADKKYDVYGMLTRMHKPTTSGQLPIRDGLGWVPAPETQTGAVLADLMKSMLEINSIALDSRLRDLIAKIEDELNILQKVCGEDCIDLQRRI